MQRNFVLFLGAVIAWTIFGAIIAVISAVIVLGATWSNWGIWGVDALILGAFVGATVGLVIGVNGLIVASVLRSGEVIIWMTGGSILGALIGFALVIIMGGYPTRSQADLGFITFGPAGLGIGGLLGSLVSITIFKARRHFH